MTRLTVLRLLVWAGPLAFAYLVVLGRKRARSLVAALVLALAWNAWSLLAVNLVAIRAGWWAFHAHAPTLMGVAIEPLAGWVVLWATVPLLGLARSAGLVVLGVAWLDLLVMPELDPLVELGPYWLWGEALSLLACLVPSILLTRWTLGRRHVGGRLALQVVATAALSLWIVPSAAFASSGGWGRILDLPSWYLASVAQLIVLIGIVAIRAAIEFAERGEGTPIPYDPPERLVTTGPFAYVRNPMQLSMVLVFLVGGIALWNAWLIAAALLAFIYSAGLAAWHEDVELSERFGSAWSGYKRSVRSWIPRVRPVTDDRATLLVAYSCGTCSSIGKWFLARDPVGLTISPAEESDDPELRRVTYVPAEGRPQRGVVAIARALEHVHLGWAAVGWVLGMPVLSHFAQLVADVFGPAPHRVAGRAYDSSACAIEGTVTR